MVVVRWWWWVGKPNIETTYRLRVGQKYITTYLYYHTPEVFQGKSTQVTAMHLNSAV